MSKPHEQEWRLFVDPANLHGQRAVVDGGTRMVCLTRSEDGAELGALIAAAPEMARALLDVLERVEYIPRSYRIPGAPTGQIETACTAAREALRKAGALP